MAKRPLSAFLLGFFSVVCTISSSTYGARLPRLSADLLVGGDWSQFNGKIVGGSEASVGEFPFQISLQRNSGFAWSHSCGGSIFNEKTILNAAHCVSGTNVNNLRVVAGEYNLNANDGTEQIRSVASYEIHPSYNSATFQDDISLIKLSNQALSFNTYVSPVTLTGTRPADGTYNTVTGWGTTSEGSSFIPAILRKVDVPIVSDEACKASYGSNSIKPGMICAGLLSGGVDSCQGDSGGPLVLRGTRTQIGIVSWGNGCARPYYYGVYTDLTRYLDWVVANADYSGSSTSTPTPITTNSATTTCKADGNYPSAPCSTTFYTCSNGIRYSFVCPANLVFYANWNRCEYRSNVPECRT